MNGICVTYTELLIRIRNVLCVTVGQIILGLGKLGKETKRQEWCTNESNFEMGRDPKKMLLLYG